MKVCPHCGSLMDESDLACPACEKPYNEEAAKKLETIPAIAYLDLKISLGAALGYVEQVFIDGKLIGRVTKAHPLEFRITRGDHIISLQTPRGKCEETKDMPFTISEKAQGLEIHIRFKMGFTINKFLVESIIEK